MFTPSAPIPTVAGCADLRPLNDAVRGEGLTPPQVECLEARVADPSDPERAAASRLLVWDARRVEDELETWRARATRHVDLAPEDLDVVLQLARSELRRGPVGAQRSLVWIERGLAWLDAHPQDDQTRHDLLKLRAIAAEMQAPPESPPEAKDRTAAWARDWWIEAKARGLETSWPMAMCTNAGGAPEWCAGGE